MIILAELDAVQVVSVSFAVVAAAAAVASVFVNWRLFRATTDPSVIVYAKYAGAGPNFLILIVIENIGESVARDCFFKLSEEIPHRIGFIGNGAGDPMTAGPLIHGIPALGPGTRRTLIWGTYPALLEHLGDRVIYVTATFRRSDGTECFPIESVLEVRSFFNSYVGAG